MERICLGGKCDTSVFAIGEVGSDAPVTYQLVYRSQVVYESPDVSRLLDSSNYPDQVIAPDVVDYIRMFVDRLTWAWVRFSDHSRYVRLNGKWCYVCGKSEELYMHWFPEENPHNKSGTHALCLTCRREHIAQQEAFERR
jgi:hypothetical protein